MVWMICVEENPEKMPKGIIKLDDKRGMYFWKMLRQSQDHQPAAIFRRYRP